MTYKILSIDAWADCCGCDHTEEDEARCWAWNNWYTIGSKISVIPDTVEQFFDMMIDQGYIDPQSKNKMHEYELDDDQYNVVLVEKKTGKPVYAVEYGSEL